MRRFVFDFNQFVSCGLAVKHQTPMYQFSAELKREKIALSESESFYLNCLIPITWELWIGGPAQCTSFQPNRRGRDEPNESESFVLFLDFIVNFS